MRDGVDCPICWVKCTAVRQIGTKDVTEYDCPRCGDYSITRPALINLENSDMSKKDRAKVAAYLRERTLRGDSRIRILSQHFPDKEFDVPVVTLDEIVRYRFPNAISDRLDRALRNLHRLSEHLGDEIFLDPEIDGPVCLQSIETPLTLSRRHCKKLAG